MEKDTADRDKLNKLNSLPIEDISLALKQTLIEEPTQVNDKRML